MGHSLKHLHIIAKGLLLRFSLYIKKWERPLEKECLSKTGPGVFKTGSPRMPT